jgi:hypothetical protein
MKLARSQTFPYEAPCIVERTSIDLPLVAFGSAPPP